MACLLSMCARREGFRFGMGVRGSTTGRREKRKRRSATGRKRSSEAGNRTPVVRVTGGNTKPLYYFGSALAPNLSFMRERTGLALTLKDFSQVRSALLFAAI